MPAATNAARHREARKGLPSGRGRFGLGRNLILQHVLRADSARASDGMPASEATVSVRWSTCAGAEAFFRERVVEDRGTLERVGYSALQRRLVSTVAQALLGAVTTRLVHPRVFDSSDIGRSLSIQVRRTRAASRRGSRYL